MSTLQERTKKGIEYAGMSPAELSRGSGASPSTVSLWLNGPTQTVDSKYVFKGARTMGVDAEWWANGVGDMLGGAHSVKETSGKYGSLEQQAADKFKLLSKRNKERALGMIKVLADKG